MRKTFKGEVILGVLIVLAGIGFLLNNIGLADWDIWGLISLLWPVILLYLGISYLYNHQSTGEIVSGVVLIVLSAVFLGNNFGVFDFSFHLLVQVIAPLILIFGGISLIRSRRGHGERHYRAILGGLEKKGEWKVESASYLAFMGGIEMDLREAEIPLGETTLHLHVFMGGIEITVPRDLKVICEGSVYLGGLELLDRATGGIVAATSSSQTGDVDPARTLNIYVQGFMGGVEIKSR